MQFIKQGKIYKAAKISGPRHNMLGLAFADDSEIDEIRIIDLPIKSNERININSSQIKDHVIEGLKKINTELKTNYKLKEIYYVPSDTPSLEVYEELVIEIIRRVDLGTFG